MSELYGSENGDQPDPDVPAAPEVPDTPDVPDASRETDQPRETSEAPDTQTDAEDEEPLTRGEYADMMREDTTAVEPDDPGDTTDDHDEQQGSAEDTAGHAEAPEPRTRQEVADETQAPDTDPQDGDTDPATDVDAALAQQEQLPEPRTRQETVDETRSGTAPAEDASETSLDHPETTSEDKPDSAPHEDSASDEPAPDEQPPQEDIDRWHQMYQEYQHEQEQADHGWGEGTDVVGEKPDRSPGDTSDLPPTGEELLSMEGDRESRLERLRRKTESPEIFDDLQDNLAKNVTLVHDAFQRPEPTGSHTEVPHQPEFTAPPHLATDLGQVAVTGLVVGVLGVELFRWVHHKVSPLKGDAHGSDR